MRLQALWNRLTPLARYILTRCVLLSCTMLASALVMLVWADSVSGPVHLLRFYADYTVDMAAVVLGSGLIGGLLLEDILVHRA